jgi:type VI secretion system protein VasJ
MSSPEALLSACTTNQEEQQRLIENASGALSLWDNWLKPVSPETETGDDPAYDDNFQLMREEINKLSGTDPALLCTLAEKILCESTKDIRVVTWYIQARLSRDGEKGLAEGLLLLVAMLSHYGKRCHPLRANARKAALEWLNSSKMLDTLSRWPEVGRDDAGLTAGAVSLLAESVAGWPENEKPSFAGLCSALENRLARSGGVEALIPQNSSTQETGRDAVFSPSPQLTAVKSGRDLLDQVKLLSGWLGEQPQGWLASHRLMKTIRWDTVDQIPPLDSAGRTRLLPPKPEYRAQLKRLYPQRFRMNKSGFSVNPLLRLIRASGRHSSSSRGLCS